VKPLAVFDLDGTLVDSRADLVASANDMLASFGAPPLREDAIAAFVGDGAKMLVARSIKAAGVPAGELAVEL
jgi:phosphoglycolate phosphatase